MKGTILTVTIMTMYSPLCNISSIVWTGWDVAARVMKISQNIMSRRTPRATVGRHLGISIFTFALFSYIRCHNILNRIFLLLSYFVIKLLKLSVYTYGLRIKLSDHLLDTTLLLWFKQVASQTDACAVHRDTTATPSPSRTTRLLYHG